MQVFLNVYRRNLLLINQVCRCDCVKVILNIIKSDKDQWFEAVL